MNTIVLKPGTSRNRSYLEIEVDGKQLSHHFAGRLGAHPSQLSAVGWSDSYIVVSQLLGKERSPLQSGRVPVLVCEECGDVGCGALAVRVLLTEGLVRWSDWAYENGREAPMPVKWPTKPEDFVFDREAYEKELNRAPLIQRGV